MRTVESSPRRAVRAALGLLATVLVVSGCLGSGSEGNKKLSLEDLQSRPTFEQGRAEYVALLEEVQAALAEITPALDWTRTRPRLESTAGCGVSTATYRGIKGAYSTGARGGIPPADWPAASRAVQRIAAAHGFTGAVVPVDSPSGVKRLVIHHPWGGTLEMGSLKGTFVTVYAPCLLHEGATPPSVDPTPSSEPTST